jgi:hypothetical protein
LYVNYLSDVEEGLVRATYRRKYERLAALEAKFESTFDVRRRPALRELLEI